MQGDLVVVVECGTHCLGGVVFPGETNLGALADLLADSLEALAVQHGRGESQTMCPG